MSRLPGWREEQNVVDNYPAAPTDVGVRKLEVRPGVGRTGVTVQMVDEAVSNVVKAQGLGVETADVFSSLASRDTHSGFAGVYYSSKAAVANAGVAGVRRPEVKVKVALTDDEVSALTAYAPEYRLVFESAINHDHGCASVCRMLDHKIVRSRLPQGIPATDVGGNPLVYIRNGEDTMHVCGPRVDLKDASRHVLRKLEAKRISTDAQAHHQVRAMAEAYLSEDRRWFCGQRGQDCAHESLALLSVHVYDIPLADWPMIMDRKRAVCVEGCVLFSQDIYDQKAGRLGVTGARFEVDPAADVFRMGFVDSPAWWYTHSWRGYLQYGSDQLFTFGGSYYSYKVVERRGDTLFFRILKTEGTPPPTVVGARRTPMAHLVKVSGFELAEHRVSAAPLSRREWHFPKRLWTEMVSQAAEDYERGVMDFVKMYKYYRTVSVRQTINAVLVIGGEPVSEAELVPLVVHACLAAAAQSILGQRETRAITDSAMRVRKVTQGSVVDSLFQGLQALLKSPFLALAAPFKAFARWIRKFHAANIEDFVLSWEPVVEVIEVPMDTLQAVGVQIEQTRSVEEEAAKSAKAGAMFDAMGAVAANPALLSVFQRLCPEHAPLPSVAKPGTVGQVGTVASEMTTAVPPSYHTNEANAVVGARQVGQSGQSDHLLFLRERTAMRKAAIAEHIYEMKEQEVATEAHCAKAYRFLFSSGVPAKRSLEACDDEYSHPDVWKVVQGVLVNSVRGLEREDFGHSAVYAPALAEGGRCGAVRSVKREKWIPPEGSSRPENVNYVIEGSRYTGYVLVLDALAVHNGTDILKSLDEALKMPHDYEVKVTQAPPGCGKTYLIKQTMRVDGTDVMACPVRESASSTRSEFSQDNPGFAEAKLRMRTVDSYLANRCLDERTHTLRAERLLADEVYMTHAGKWYAMAALLGVKSVECYGDEKQIPHIPRVAVPALHVRVQADEDDGIWENRRNPPAAVAAWMHLYESKVRARSRVTGVFDEIKSTDGREIEDGTVMMCMYQADKAILRKLYHTKRGKVKIMTAHESEGKTYRRVWLHKFDPRVRTDKSSLFDSEPHCLVAASRHTHEFLYVNPGAPDLISQWVTRAKESRRVAAASDVKSAGTRLEFK